MHAGLLLVLVFLSFSLYIISSWTLSTSSAWSTYLLKQQNSLIHSGPQLNEWSAPPYFLADTPSSTKASCPAQSIVFGQARLLALDLEALSNGLTECIIRCWHFGEWQITISNQIALLLLTVVSLKSLFELFNISLWSVLTKVAKHELC